MKLEEQTIPSVLAFVWRATGFNVMRAEWLSFAYIGAVLLVFVAKGRMPAAFNSFAITGRMALTNYMAQVIFLDTMFEPHGFNVQIAPLTVPVWGLGLFALQAMFCRWWLRRYRIVPLEWLWRSATYWRWQPLRV